MESLSLHQSFTTAEPTEFSQLPSVFPEYYTAARNDCLFSWPQSAFTDRSISSIHNGIAAALGSAMGIVHEYFLINCQI